jgi:hypothetical protein
MTMLSTEIEELKRLRGLALLFWTLIGDLGGEVIFDRRTIPNDGAPIAFDIIEDQTEIRVYRAAEKSNADD